MKALLPARLAAAQGLFQRHGRARPDRSSPPASSAGTSSEQFVSNTLAGQFAQALQQHPRDPRHGRRRAREIVRLTCYVTSIDEYLASARRRSARRGSEIMGTHYPAMALVEVVRLVERAAKVEIEATAVVPE